MAIFMKRASRCKAFRNLFFAAITAALLISGIIRPLFVQCTPADGHTTLEFIGRDPHHHVHSEDICEFSKSASGSSFSFCVAAYSECVDLFLNHTAILRIGIHAPWTESILGATGNLFTLIASRTFQSLDFRTDPAFQTSFPPQFKQALRI